MATAVAALVVLYGVVACFTLLDVGGNMHEFTPGERVDPQTFEVRQGPFQEVMQAMMLSR